jgi:hypothetical protein
VFVDQGLDQNAAHLPGTEYGNTTFGKIFAHEILRVRHPAVIECAGSAFRWRNFNCE